MEPLVERIARATAGHPSPALPLHELRQMVGGSGVAVTENVLLQALDRARSRFRVLDPWRGPWRSLIRPGRRSGPPPDDPLPDTLALEPWVMTAPDAAGIDGESTVLGRMRGTLVHLGWVLDEQSPVDMARWCGQVRESRRVRDRVRNVPGR